jgi:hypothetical protein
VTVQAQDRIQQRHLKAAHHRHDNDERGYTQCDADEGKTGNTIRSNAVNISNPKEEGRKQFFFEKKNQKTFVSCGQHQIGLLEPHAGRHV